MTQTSSNPIQVFRKPIEAELLQVQSRIAEVLRSPEPQINASLEYLTRQTGKMLRPTLVLLCGRCLGPIGEDHIHLAAMVELVHRASLLHDDVIDSAEIRRTDKTANALWGNTAAVLMGDFLLCRAFYLGSQVHCTAAAEILGQAAQKLCSGELLQNFQKGRWDITEQDYYCIIEAKTASLFESSCRLGAIAAEADDTQIEAFGRFGVELGLAFQVTDDLLDFLGTPRQAGKTLGTDLAQGKLTLPLIHWIGSDATDKARRIRMIQSPCNTDALIEQMRESGSIDYALSRVRKHIAAAQEALSDFSQTPAKDALMRLSDYVAERLR